MMNGKLTGLALATAAAGLFAVGSLGVAMADDTTAAGMKCEHSSACKGQGACKTAANSCKGQNGCKGQGFTMQKSATDCSAAQAAAKK